ncbi:MAG TPA: hypothetical protein VM282_21310 [Acidimicrobiales bacterium]|nr:hypothetical protein [Acidimicrobiales bacterium]
MTRRSLYIVALAPAVLAGANALAVWPGRDDRSPRVGDEELHIHDLAVDSANGEIFVATHSGLFRIGRDHKRASVLDASDDVTAFTISPDGRYFIGGHPDLSRVGRFQAPGKPPLLGLVVSDDRGRSWSNVSLLGEADFHALVAVGTYLYAADSTSGRLSVSGDGGQSWESRGAVELIDLAVDPRDVNRMVGVGLTERFEQRLEASPTANVFVSRDRVATWQPAPE